MVTGALAEVMKEGDKENIDLLSQATFMPILDCLRVCEEYLGEKFNVLAS